MQLDLFITPVPRAIHAPATQRGPRRMAGVPSADKMPPPVPQLTVAEMLNRGSKVEFPKNANAIRVTIGSKTIVILKADADTLKGVGVAQTVEFGTVRNDAKGHPIRKDFALVAADPLQEGGLFGETLI